MAGNTRLMVTGDGIGVILIALGGVDTGFWDAHGGTPSGKLLTADQLAESVARAIGQPSGVDVNTVIVRPAGQRVQSQPDTPNEQPEGDSPLTDQTPLPAPAYTPGDLDRFIDLLGAALVPHAGSVLYAATTRDGVTACQDSMLWLAGGSGARLFSDNEGAQSRPAVSADGARAAFLQAVGGNRQRGMRPLAGGGETTVLTCFGRGTGPVGPQWSPDGQSIAIDACDAPGTVPCPTVSPHRSGAQTGSALPRTLAPTSSSCLPLAGRRGG
jgi:hypothetical protein